MATSPHSARMAAAVVASIGVAGAGLYGTGKSAKSETKNATAHGGPEDSDPNAMSSSQLINELHKKPMVPGKTATQDKA
ncbi:hypothetical protein PENSPDRAFT_680172 [Peniophora sp. CONT]|nr:hypothetical protein PENSPDRAFT_680172 [Peniophora sp. CONT]